jgi:hypothetical protein
MGCYRIISESGWSGDKLVFEHEDKWEIVRWFALNRPEPEGVALDAKPLSKTEGFLLRR